MKLLNLHIRNIGPFRDATLEFQVPSSVKPEEQPVTIITGMNGAGKSIVIDAIRAAFGGGNVLERNIVANQKDFLIELDMKEDGKMQHCATSSLRNGYIEAAIPLAIYSPLLYGYTEGEKVYDWVIDYWSAKSSTDPFKISNIRQINHLNVLKGVMTGKKSHVDLVNFICQTDYLRSSEMPAERELGNFIYAKLKEIIHECLEDGTFKYVRRTDLTPVVEQNGVELSLEKLSNGNLFLLEHLVLLLCKMYSVAVLNNLPPEAITQIPGLLLIDEIETHLHPKWQKKILVIIRRFFPKLQIILTTHSPFVVASINGARIYTCVSRTGYSEICDETEQYANMPVEEILMSDAFGEVHPFNEEITRLMHRRKELIEAGEKEKAREVARQLYDINPDYFSYLRF